jgi:hypothetical protein
MPLRCRVEADRSSATSQATLRLVDLVTCSKAPIVEVAYRQASESLLSSNNTNFERQERNKKMTGGNV